MTPPRDCKGERHGRRGFDEKVDAVTKTLTRKLNNKAEQTLQTSVALVLRSGSGVGKTYATQTARYGSLRLQEKRKEEPKPCEDCPYDLYSAYIGFNVGESLTKAETEYMERMVSADAIAVVILTRLLAWLSPFVASFCPEGKAYRPEGKGEDWDAVMQPQYPVADAAVGAMPFDMMYFSADTTRALKLLLEKVAVCLRALADARKVAEQKPLALLVAVDEGQMLDELEGYKPNRGKKSGGARWALRGLRELQTKALSCGVVLVPICTGINPEVSLSDSTLGGNVPLKEAGEVLMLPSEWRDYCEEHLGKKTKGSDPRAVDTFYALLWPRARHVATIALSVMATQEAPLYWREHGDTEEKRARARARTARAVLKAAADQEEHRGAPCNMVHYGNVPVVDYSVLIHFTEALRLTAFAVAAKSDMLQGTALSFVDVCSITSEHALFERFAFDVLVAFAAYFYHKQPDQKYVPERRWTKQLTNWLPEGTATFKFCGALVHPFANKKGLPESLSEKFKEKLEELQKKDDALLVRCGGNAPIDFLLVKVIDVTEVDGSPVRTLTVRYADAKHAWAGESRGCAEKFFTGEHGLDGITTKAEETHAKLSSVLPRGYALSAFEARHVLMVTNKTLAGHGSDMLEEIPASLERVVNPQTTQWLPLTLPLFCCLLTTRGMCRCCEPVVSRSLPTTDNTSNE